MLSQEKCPDVVEFTEEQGSSPSSATQLTNPLWPSPHLFPCGSAGKESASNVGDLGWEDLLEKGKATHSRILAWRIPRAVESMGSQRVGHN